MTLFEKLRPLVWMTAESKVTDSNRHFPVDLCTKLMSGVPVTSVDLCTLRTTLDRHPYMVDSLEKDEIYEAIDQHNKELKVCSA